MKIVQSGTKKFVREADRIEQRGRNTDGQVEETVREILNQVRKEGDRAVVRLTKKFDGLTLSPKGYGLTKKEIQRGTQQTSKEIFRHLTFAAKRIEKFHLKQRQSSWTVKEAGGHMGQIIRPLEKAGIYAPGGKAAYPSSVLMNAIPAKVAGVKQIVLCTPAPGGEMNPAVIAAAHIAGVDAIFPIGGAQSIGAMAYGTAAVPRVDKITGPGNVYVAEAKRQVYGLVDIDMVAGPSEILILADDKGKPDFIAADLISQAEHDEQAYPLLITDSPLLAEKVRKELQAQTKKLSRGTLIRASLKKNCIVFIVKNMEEGMALSNRFAPEHLEIMTVSPHKLLKQVTNAGAVFLGNYTPEAVGDYAAGPNHVLPTGGTARFFSPLGVYDFQKRTSLISLTKNGLKALHQPVTAIAEEEGLTGHAEAVRIRMKNCF